jgi:hypothetical protein
MKEYRASIRCLKRCECFAKRVVYRSRYLAPQLLDRDSVELLAKVLRHLLQVVHQGTAFLDPCRGGQVFNLRSEVACLCRKRADHAAKLMSSLARARTLAIAKLLAGLETYVLRWCLLADIFEKWDA